jgi:nucleoside phosphorylase
VIASGNMVVQNMDSPIIRPMLELEPNLLAIEMEGGGGAAAVHNLQQQELNREGFGVGFFMIRGISDVIRSADSDHNLEDQSGERYRWTLYASASAATYAIELIRRRWPFAPRS